MSERYIRRHFDDIKKYAGVIEERLDDGYCTQQNVLRDNASVMQRAQEYGVNYCLIDDDYVIDTDSLVSGKKDRNVIAEDSPEL